jgi:hypothetical protein
VKHTLDDPIFGLRLCFCFLGGAFLSQNHVKIKKEFHKKNSYYNRNNLGKRIGRKIFIYYLYYDGLEYIL